MIQTGCEVCGQVIKTSLSVSGLLLNNRSTKCLVYIACCTCSYACSVDVLEVTMTSAVCISDNGSNFGDSLCIIVVNGLVYNGATLEWPPLTLGKFFGPFRGVALAQEVFWYHLCYKQSMLTTWAVYI